MDYFSKVKFEELSKDQKIDALQQMLNFFRKTNDYASKIDDEWHFEIINPLKTPNHCNLQKTLCYNKEQQERDKHLEGTYD